MQNLQIVSRISPKPVIINISNMGVIGGASGDFGLGGSGIGANSSIGGDLFWGGSKSANIGGFTSGGVFSGGPEGAHSYPSANSCGSGGTPPFVVGAYAGVGSLGFSAQFGYSNGTGILSLTFGPGAGLNFGQYPTNTWTTK